MRRCFRAEKHCQQYHKKKIILVLPCLSIIEQNRAEYRQLVPDLLKLHSSAESEKRSRILGQRWSAPCILITNVGFGEPLLPAKPSAVNAPLAELIAAV